MRSLRGHGIVTDWLTWRLALQVQDMGMDAVGGTI